MQYIAPLKKKKRRKEKFLFFQKKAASAKLKKELELSNKCRVGQRTVGKLVSNFLRQGGRQTKTWPIHMEIKPQRNTCE